MIAVDGIEIDNADIDPLDFHDTDTAQAMVRDWRGLQPAVLARAGQILATDVDRLTGRLDESDQLVLRLEAERDELREEFTAEIRRLHAIEDELLAALQVADDAARGWNDGEWQTGPRGTAAMTALVEALEKLPKG